MKLWIEWKCNRCRSIHRTSYILNRDPHFYQHQAGYHGHPDAQGTLKTNICIHDYGRESGKSKTRSIFFPTEGVTIAKVIEEFKSYFLSTYEVEEIISVKIEDD
jgi:hypothetical protein